MAKERIKKPFYKRWWFWAIAVILVIAIATGGGEDDTDLANDAGDAAPPETEEGTDVTEGEKKEETKTYKIGDAVKVGDVVFTVHGKSTANNVGGEYGQNASGTYLILDVTVKNEGKEAIMTDSSFFKLLQGDTEYNADDSATLYANEAGKGFFLEEINPNLENRGKVVFDVADPKAAYKLQVQSGFWGTETQTIDLQ
ncbi:MULTISPECIES: DUF4352 domain-containing protein [Metabacillus]|uniref:DUF4352 domain-containing protein n=2 Tax=Metabacillus TaxID=2675233 RepID=A0A179SR48_9BACI|nr:MULTISPECIES: DUF4352 domain-containing protein [Metabacillus]OAS82762.1 hypothetical protein A6K24_11615 [Metabacillus litoralis]QNF30203.1 DUF4352 domain-containing protein [Metabacillus sp. KUDC1714]